MKRALNWRKPSPRTAAMPRLARGALPIALVFLIVGLTPSGVFGEGVPPAPPLSAADKDHLLYELGVQMSSVIQTLDLSAAEFKKVNAGLADGYNHRADLELAATYEPRLQALRRVRLAAITQREENAGRAYLQKAAMSPGARKTDSGLIYIPVREGTGPKPAARDRVQMRYVGRRVDGTVYDSSSERGEPATLSLGLVMPCFTEALQLMKVGGKSRIVCPAELAYGDRGSLPEVLPGSTLEFEVELLTVNPSGSADASSKLSDRKPPDRD